MSKHTTVFGNLATDKPRTIYIATLHHNRLGVRVSPIVLLDYCGNIIDSLKAYDSGNAKEGARILMNQA